MMLRRISVRVALLSTVLVLAAMALAATVMTNLHRDAIERRFDDLTDLHMFNLVGGVSLSGNGTLVGSPNLGDLRYNTPGSGWAWQVVPVSETVRGQLRSFSIRESLTLPDRTMFPLDAGFQRRFTHMDGEGRNVRVLEREVALGSDDAVALFTVVAATAEIDSEVATFRNQVLIWLFGIALVGGLVNVIAIVGGLMPLDAARRQLSGIRAGERERLEGRFPAEIDPLAREINELIDNNRAVVERARRQVGDLAHSLKTPLSVITNEARAMADARGELIGDQAASIRQQIDRYLQKARIAAQRGGTAFRSDVVPLVARMVRVFAKLSPAIRFDFSHRDASALFAGEAEDFDELLGNLLENAAKWGRSSVRVDVARQGTEIVLTVEDDGPGIPAEKRADALGRGKRLDETKPGTGLGLSIVKDLVGAYGGSLDLGDATAGGLRVVVRLPAVQGVE